MEADKTEKPEVAAVLSKWGHERSMLLSKWRHEKYVVVKWRHIAGPGQVPQFPPRELRNAQTKVALSERHKGGKVPEAPTVDSTLSFAGTPAERAHWGIPSEETGSVGRGARVSCDGVSFQARGPRGRQARFLRHDGYGSDNSASEIRRAYSCFSGLVLLSGRIPITCGVGQYDLALCLRVEQVVGISSIHLLLLDRSGHLESTCSRFLVGGGVCSEFRHHRRPAGGACFVSRRDEALQPCSLHSERD